MSMYEKKFTKGNRVKYGEIIFIANNRNIAQNKQNFMISMIFIFKLYLIFILTNKNSKNIRKLNIKLFSKNIFFNLKFSNNFICLYQPLINIIIIKPKTPKIPILYKKSYWKIDTFDKKTCIEGIKP